MNVWLHRISHCYEVSEPLLEQNYLTIGFSDYVEKYESYPDDKTIQENFEKDMANIYAQNFRQRFNLRKFLFEFKVGDLVIVPSWGKFSVYRILDLAVPMIRLPQEVLDAAKINAYFGKDGLLWEKKTDQEIDLGFFIKVEPVKQNIPRDGYCSSALISRMKIRNATAMITGLEKDVLEAVRRHEENNPIDFHDEASKVIRDHLKKIILDKLDDIRFEKLVLWYLKKIGATEAYIPAKNESGKEDGADADVVAIFELFKVIIYVQVKHHDGQTSDWAVQQIAKYKEQKDQRDDPYTRLTWVITSAEFTDDAKSKAQADEVRLIDQNEFAEMLIDVGLEGINSAF
ncbi:MULTISPECIES: restriction endonuclease [Acetobacterium]|jgi:predicted Mrr-cat superfamily restriction endonuclease|uniref:Restriction endonuclease n=1 Tax=Acetobacterium wieringae TaxID=52694 RepID=A0A1F2PL53_9FIRM|nr:MULTISPECIES: restriction endonuclease [Acetobacterium]OFV71416.1 restriction endonuclease [Acetobacterium wieringae]